MKITLKMLEDDDDDACSDGIDWFKANFKSLSADSADILKLLIEQKNSNGYSGWLFRFCKLSGLCKSWYEDESIMYKHNYKNGNEHGKCIGYFEDGSKMYEINYKDGKFHGLCKWYYEDGSIMYKHNYKDGEKHGKCIDYYPDGSIMYEWNYKNGVIQ